MADNNNMNGKDFLLGAVVGGLLGAVTALLLAPKSGKELRTDIAEGYHNVSEKTQEIAGTVGQKSQEIAKVVGEQTSEWTGKAKETVNHVVSDIKSWNQSRKETAASIESEEPQAIDTTSAVKNENLGS